MTSPDSLAERLEKAITTASNDDYSKPGTVERSRHAARIDVMQEAVAALRSSASAREVETRVAIWSGEHCAYWRANGAGYTTDIRSIGSYSYADAVTRTKHCGPEKMIELIPWPGALAPPASPTTLAEPEAVLCSDCPPVGYPTDETRCSSCPRQRPIFRTLAEPEAEGA